MNSDGDSKNDGEEEQVKQLLMIIMTQDVVYKNVQ